MNRNKNIDFRISLDNSLIIKGIAICLMLWHHLFLTKPEYGSFVFQTAQFGKVCVSLFLFVSAYGLTVQYGKIFDKPVTETFKFMAKRFVKFYTNYWVIFLIFVPLGVFVFGHELNIPYQSQNTLPVKSIIRDLLGLNGFQSYNTTWWFNRLIISLYLLFPVLYFLARKWAVLLLLVSAVVWEFYLPVLPVGVFEYMFHFVLGIVFALHIDKINNFLNRFNFWILLALLLLVFGALFYLRTTQIIPFLTGIRIDAFLSVNIVILVLLIIRHTPPYIRGALKFSGKHSINIYMVHTFIYYYWFGEFIYLFKYPALIFTVLLICSLGVSIAVEYLKKTVKIPALIKAINSKIDNSRVQKQLNEK